MRHASVKVPAYRQIQEAIRQRIGSGELKQGEVIESERELAKAFGVSLMTARHALAQLEREGVVTRRAGVGTFVAPPRIHFNNLVGFTQQMRSRGFMPRSRIVGANGMKGTEEICATLGLQLGTEILKLERVRYCEREPFAVETCYVSRRDFPDLLTRMTEEKSLFEVFERECGVEIGYAEEELDATAADPRTAALLEVAVGAPLFRLRQVLYSKSAQRMGFMIGVYHSERFSMHIRRPR